MTNDRMLQESLAGPGKGATALRALGQIPLMLPLNCHRASTRRGGSSLKTHWRRSWRVFCKTSFDSVSCFLDSLFLLSYIFSFHGGTKHMFLGVSLLCLGVSRRVGS